MKNFQLVEGRFRLSGRAIFSQLFGFFAILFMEGASLHSTALLLFSSYSYTFQIVRRGTHPLFGVKFDTGSVYFL